MLPRRNRLTKRHDIVSTLRRGTAFPTPIVAIHVCRRNDPSAVRVAVIVAKKVHASAVQRHRYQRWLRTAAAELIPQLAYSADMVWVAKPAITRLASANDVTAKLSRTFATIKKLSS